MNYAEAIKYLYEQLPMYQRVGAAAYKENLDNTLALDEMFRHPHRSFKSVHVAGTNGKGSVSHQLASILQSASYKVGLYTSPHLKDYRERIKINGTRISEEAVADFVSRFQRLNKTYHVQPSFFELSVLMAFDFFSSEKVDFAIVEVGLGGRLDSTNIITPEVSIITNISLDHTNLLGNTLPKIAMEKAGIIKKNVPVVIGESQQETTPVFIAKANTEDAEIIFADAEYTLTACANGALSIVTKNDIEITGLIPDLKGDYQFKNIITSYAAIKQLQKYGVEITVPEIITGYENVIKNTGLLGRWQILQESPKVICDTGHNEGGIRFNINQLKKEKAEKLHIVFGAVNDKNIDKVLQLMPVEATYYFTQASINRALDANKLREEALRYNLKGQAFSTVVKAYQAALQNAGVNDVVYVGGSTFVVAEVLP